MKKNALFRDLRLLYKISLVVSHSSIIRIFFNFPFCLEVFDQNEIIKTYSYNFPRKKQHHMMLPFVTPETI